MEMILWASGPNLTYICSSISFLSKYNIQFGHMVQIPKIRGLAHFLRPNNSDYESENPSLNK